ncbi:Guanine nucleotide exchange factor lte1 [Malassezia caprae]|uniref:Guanine nucleotide exchange factor lte1 n=1 Tax=Malassezia caprae TaxID=1381934 RepID=A0AAF0E6H4_9BASI|nr:Guanine nucleotide exchange factor lte1 [Malassezia caprae]
MHGLGIRHMGGPSTLPPSVDTNASAPVPRPMPHALGPPSGGTPVVSSAPQFDNGTVDESKQEDLSFTTAPMNHGEAMPSQPRSTLPTAADMTQSTVSNDISYEETFGADALIRPYDPSNDSSIFFQRESSLEHHVPQRSSELEALHLTDHEETTLTQPVTNVLPTSMAELDGPSTTSTEAKALASDGQAQPQAPTVAPAVHSGDSTLAAQETSTIPGYQDRAAPAPPLDSRFMAGLGPVLPKSQSMAYLSSGTVSSSEAPPMPAVQDSSAAASSPPVTKAEEPVTVFATTNDTPDVVLGSRPNHYASMKMVHITPAGPGAHADTAPVGSPVSPSWGPSVMESKPISDAATKSVADDAATPEASPAAAPAPDTSSEGRVPTKAYRVEWMFGPHTLVYDDACTKPTGPVPVAYTYDDWFVERPRMVQGKPSGNNSTAIVVSCPPLSALNTVPLYLGTFSSTLVPTPDAPYALDMASPLDFEVPPNVPLEGTKVVTLTGIRRNVRLLSRNQHQVVAATVHRLVAEMTSGSSPGLMQDVFLGYRQYLGAGRLLELLLSRMEWSIAKIGDASAFKAALSVLLHTQAALWHWLHYYYEHDFAGDEALTRRLVHWMADQDHRVQFWQYANDPSAIVAPPTLKEVPTAAVPEQDEELPNNDPSERMHSLWALVQALVPAALLPEQDGQVDAQNEAPHKVTLHKSRSLSRMLALSSSPSRSRKHHSRWPSIGGTSVLAAVGSVSAVNGPTGSPHMPSSSYKSPGPSTMPSPSMGDTSLEPAPQGRLERNRSLKNLRRIWRRADAPGDGSAEDNSPRAKMDAPMLDDEADEDTREQDAALQLLEQALSESPGADALPSPRHKDGPIQWIPSHTSTSWREAQRLSMVTAQAMWEKNPTVPASQIQQRDTFLLCQRSSTIARQLGTIERQLLACVQWHELAEPSWEQHTVQQDQWQREYQEYIVARIRAASSTEEGSALPKAEGVHMLIARFNRACAWVATHIVTTSDLKERVMVVNKFIRIAWHCFRQGNMETLCQIMFGLQSPWVARLQRTWGQVALWELRAFDALRRFTSPRNQFAFLRQSMVEALEVNTTVKRRFSNPSSPSAPYVPFFGLFISDLSTVDGLASFVDSSLMPNMIPFYDDQELSQSWDVLVNVYRLRIKACIVREFITMQRHERSAPEHPMELPILVESLQLDTLSAASIQSASLALEP